MGFLTAIHLLAVLFLLLEVRSAGSALRRKSQLGAGGGSKKRRGEADSVDKFFKGPVELQLLGTTTTSKAELAWSSSPAFALIIFNLLIASLRCLLTVGQSYAAALQERAAHKLQNLLVFDEELLAELPDPRLPSLSALAHLGLSLVSSLLLGSFMQKYSWLKAVLMFRRVKTLQKAEAVHVAGTIAKLHPATHVPPTYFTRGGRSLVDLDPSPASKSAKANANDNNARIFTLDDQTYLLTNNPLRAVPIRPITDGAPTANLFPLLQSHLRTGLSHKQAAQRLQLFGNNTLDMPILSASELLRRRFLSPFSLVQLSSQFLSIVEESWFLPVVRIAGTVFSEGFQIFRDCHSAALLRDRKTNSTDAAALSRVLRDGIWTVIQTSALVPGDIIALPLPCADNMSSHSSLPRLPCDCLLLSGNAVVSEAAQTGESVPQSKTALLSDSFDGVGVFSSVRTHHHILLSGSAIIQATLAPSPPSAPQCLTALVLRTGFHSSQGELLRKMKAGGEAGLAGQHQTRDVQRLAAILTSWAVVCSLYLAARAPACGRDSFSTAVQITRLALSVVPPDLQSELSFSVHEKTRRLAKECEIFCLEPARLTTAGLITTCILDKTGTITADSMVLEGCVGCFQENYGSATATTAAAAAASAGAPATSLSPLDTPLLNQACLATCHTLIHLAGSSNREASGGQGRGQEEECALVGDPMEMATVEKLKSGAGWVWEGGAARFVSSDSRVVLTPAKVWEFDPALRRMTVVSTVRGTAPAFRRGSDLLIATKGAPESVLQCLHEGQRDDPMFCEWYGRTHKQLSQQGLRVLAVASRVGGDNSALSSQARSSHESNLTFSSFLTFRCPIRADSSAAVGYLRQAGIEVVMCTGDGLGTAAYVARATGIGFIGDAIGSSQQNSSAIVNGKRSSSNNNSSSRSSSNEFADYTELCFEDEGDEAAGAARDSRRLVWRNFDGDVLWRYGLPGAVSGRKGQRQQVPAMSCYELRSLGGYTLATTGAIVKHCTQRTPEKDAMLADLLHCSIFARVEPDTKTDLVKAYQGKSTKSNRRKSKSKSKSKSKTASSASARRSDVVLMVGDGSNDIGALRAADVGLALLGGWGLKNVVEGYGTVGNNRSNVTISGNRSTTANASASVVPTEPAAVRAERMRARVEKLAARYRREAFADGRRTWGFREYFKSLREVWKDEAANIVTSANSIVANGEEVKTISIGDASVAAAFTSRRPSLSSAVDLVRFGRATQCVVLQSYLQTALDCCMCGHSLSFGFLRNIRKSAKHYYLAVMVTGVLTAATEAVPVLPATELADTPPPASIFTGRTLRLLALQALAFMAASPAALHLGGAQPRQVAAVAAASAASAPAPVVAVAAPASSGDKFAATRETTIAVLVDILRYTLTPVLTHFGRPWMPEPAEVPMLKIGTSVFINLVRALVVTLSLRDLKILDLLALGGRGGAGVGAVLIATAWLLLGQAHIRTGAKAGAGERRASYNV